MESPGGNFLAICLTNRESPDQRLVFTTSGKKGRIMKSSWNGNDPQVLKEFLYQLFCHAKGPEEIDLLLEVILTIQAPRVVPSRLAEVIPIGPATRTHVALDKEGDRQ
jgi:hypothetical protein